MKVYTNFWFWADFLEESTRPKTSKSLRDQFDVKPAADDRLYKQFADLGISRTIPLTEQGRDRETPQRPY
jgi:hypothetical protein